MYSEAAAFACALPSLFLLLRVLGKPFLAARKKPMEGQEEALIDLTEDQELADLGVGGDFDIGDSGEKESDKHSRQMAASSKTTKKKKANSKKKTRKRKDKSSDEEAEDQTRANVLYGDDEEMGINSTQTTKPRAGNKRKASSKSAQPKQKRARKKRPDEILEDVTVIFDADLIGNEGAKYVAVLQENKIKTSIRSLAIKNSIEWMTTFSPDPKVSLNLIFILFFSFYSH